MMTRYGDRTLLTSSLLDLPDRTFLAKILISKFTDFFKLGKFTIVQPYFLPDLRPFLSRILEIPNPDGIPIKIDRNLSGSGFYRDSRPDKIFEFSGLIGIGNPISI